MAVFSYQAINGKGRTVKGSLDAETREDALGELNRSGSTVITLEEAGVLNRDVKLNIGGKKPKNRDLAVFCRQFVSIIDAGVPVVSALEMLAEQTENKMLASAIGECKISIEQGETLANSMAKFPKVFPSMLVTLVEAGEASGSLNVSFARMADQFERDEVINSTIRKATIYPTFIIVVAIVALGGLLTFVVPTFESLLTDLDVKLPGITVVVLAVARFFQHRWYIVIPALLLIVFGSRSFSHTDRGGYFFGKIKLKLPLFGDLAKKTASARMSRTMETLLRAGLPLADTLTIVSDTMTNVYFRDTLLAARDAVMLGSPLAAQFWDAELFPPLVRHMIGIGEDTGSIEEMLSKLADYYEEEVQGATERLMAALEPTIILVMAVLIGTVIVSLVLPMASMYNGLNNL